MYVPTKLQPYFELDKEKLVAGNIIVKGTLSCCGQYDFNIQYFGELELVWIGRSVIFTKDGTVILTASCNNCGREIQVFNSDTDGYDGSTNSVNRCNKSLPELSDFLCPTCSNALFSIEITFEYQSKDELEEDGVQEYENAFSSVWISLNCSSCKRKAKNIIDMETA
jgi:WD40 repeat protein